MSASSEGLALGTVARPRAATVLHAGIVQVARAVGRISARAPAERHGHLAASGLFAVLAHSVESRRREFGIRIALGAHSERVVGQVLREGMAFPIVGLTLGMGAAVWFTRVMQSLLFETSPQEPRVG